MHVVFVFESFSLEKIRRVSEQLAVNLTGRFSPLIAAHSFLFRDQLKKLCTAPATFFTFTKGSPSSYTPVELKNNNTSKHFASFLLNTAKNSIKLPTLQNFFVPATMNYYYRLFKSQL